MSVDTYGGLSLLSDLVINEQSHAFGCYFHDDTENLTKECVLQFSNRGVVLFCVNGKVVEEYPFDQIRESNISSQANRKIQYDAGSCPAYTQTLKVDPACTLNGVAVREFLFSPSVLGRALECRDALKTGNGVQYGVVRFMSDKMELGKDGSWVSRIICVSNHGVFVYNKRDDGYVIPSVVIMFNSLQHVSMIGQNMLLKLNAGEMPPWMQSVRHEQGVHIIQTADQKHVLELQQCIQDEVSKLKKSTSGELQRVSQAQPEPPVLNKLTWPAVAAKTPADMVRVILDASSSIAVQTSTQPDVKQLDDQFCKVIMTSKQNVAVLTKSGKVYTWGEKPQGRGNLDLSPGKPGLITGLLGLNIMDIVGGTDFLLVLTDQGKVYGMGCNDKSQIGKVSGTPSDFHNYPVELKIDAGDGAAVKKVFSTADRTILVFETGVVYDLTRRVVIPKIKHVVQSICGNQEELFILVSGGSFFTYNYTNGETTKSKLTEVTEIACCEDAAFCISEYHLYSKGHAKVNGTTQARDDFMPLIVKNITHIYSGVGGVQIQAIDALYGTNVSQCLYKIENTVVSASCAGFMSVACMIRRKSSTDLGNVSAINASNNTTVPSSGRVKFNALAAIDKKQNTNTYTAGLLPSQSQKEYRVGSFEDGNNDRSQFTQNISLEAQSALNDVNVMLHNAQGRSNSGMALDEDRMTTDVLAAASVFLLEKGIAPEPPRRAAPPKPVSGNVGSIAQSSTINEGSNTVSNNTGSSISSTKPTTVNDNTTPVNAQPPVQNLVLPKVTSNSLGSPPPLPSQPSVPLPIPVNKAISSGSSSNNNNSNNIVSGTTTTSTPTTTTTTTATSTASSLPRPAHHVPRTTSRGSFSNGTSAGPPPPRAIPKGSPVVTSSANAPEVEEAPRRSNVFIPIATAGKKNIPVLDDEQSDDDW